MPEEHECPDYGTDYDAEDATCAECVLAEECEKLTQEATSKKPAKKQKVPVMGQNFW